MTIETPMDTENPSRTGHGGLDEHELAALVVALRCRAARAAASRQPALTAPGVLPIRTAWMGHAPHEAVWSRRVG